MKNRFRLQFLKLSVFKDLPQRDETQNKRFRAANPKMNMMDPKKVIFRANFFRIMIF